MTSQQLKNSILQMAVQGLLVPQDPNDEPASVLLQRIREEKQKLVKEGKIKKEKHSSVIFRGSDNLPYESRDNSTPVCIAELLPFEIPESWEWARLNVISEMFTGNSINETEKKKNFTDISEGLNYIATKDVGFDNTINYCNGVKIPLGIGKFRIAPANSVLLCIEGGSAGRKIALLEEDVCFGNKLCCFISNGIDYEFLFYFLQSPCFRLNFKMNETGIIGGVSINSLKQLFIPIPPLAEQRRIVAKLEELLPLVEEYGKAESTLTTLNATFPEALKKSILQDAVQGKLVPQDPDDEPASVLLERIRQEKKALDKTKKGKRNPVESRIVRRDNSYYELCDGVERYVDELLPFEIPDSWEWARLNVISEMFTGNSINETEKKKNFTNISEGLNYIATKDVGFDNTINYCNGVKIPLGIGKFRIAPANSVLLCIEGGSAGRKIALLEEDVCFGNKLCCFISNGIDYEFLYYFLQSPCFRLNFKMNETGIIGGVSINSLKQLFIPIPPLAEQRRIVAKLEELLPLVEEYGKAESTLTTLNATFPEALKKSILQDAVQGKLVPQDPDDEPASVLLERIRQEKKALDKTKKGKRNPVESRIVRRDNSYYELRDGVERCIDEFLPFEIPESWEWARLGEVASVNGGYAFKSVNFIETGVRVVRISDFNETGFVCKKIVRHPYSDSLEEFLLREEDILLCMTGGTVGKSLFVEKLHEPMLVNQRVATIRAQTIDKKYLFYTILTSSIQRIIDKEKNSTNDNISIDLIKSFMIPIPPLEEQRRIVAKIEELLKQVEKLK